MPEWIAKNQKTLSLSLGSLMLLIALGLFFWSNESSVSKEERLAQASIARMEARMNTQSNTQADKKSASLETFYETRDKQMRYLLIAMIISGIGFLGFGFLKKS